MSPDRDGEPAVHINTGGPAPAFDPRVVMREMSRTKERTTALAPSLVGLSELTARSRAEAAGCVLRVARRDEEAFLLTADFCASRITLQIEHGVVVEAEARG